MVTSAFCLGVIVGAVAVALPSLAAACMRRCSERAPEAGN